MLVCTGVHVCVLVCTCVHVCVLVCTCVHARVLVCIGKDETRFVSFCRLDQAFSDAFTRDFQLIKADLKHSM